MSLPVFHRSYIRVGPTCNIGSNGDGEWYGRSSMYIYFSGGCRITDRNAVVERDEEGVGVSAKVISVYSKMRLRHRSDNLTVFRE